MQRRADFALAGGHRFALRSVNGRLNECALFGRSAQIAFDNFFYQQHVIRRIIKRIKEMNSASYGRYVDGDTIYPH